MSEEAREMAFAVRAATSDEMEAIQATWDAIDFVRSADGDLVLVAIEARGERVGQGRLVRLEAGHVELGGMWVRDDWRGRGVARALVRSLLDAAGAEAVWCVPWADLADYYRALGLSVVAREVDAPEAIRAKLAHCRGRYARAVTLLRRP
ncbi:MAG: GNAT family N-acetyltransferase [Polyangiales bacterium]